MKNYSHYNFEFRSGGRLEGTLDLFCSKMPFILEILNKAHEILLSKFPTTNIFFSEVYDFEAGLNFLRRLIEKNLEQNIFEFPAEDRRLSFLYAFLRDYCIGCGKNSFECKGGCVDGVDEAMIIINKLKSSFYEKRSKGHRGEENQKQKT